MQLARDIVTCWAAMLENKEAAAMGWTKKMQLKGLEKEMWQTKTKAVEFHRRLGEDDNQEPGTERSADREETRRALQILRLLMKGNDAKEPSSAEEVDLGYIDLAERVTTYSRR